MPVVAQFEKSIQETHGTETGRKFGRSFLTAPFSFRASIKLSHPRNAAWLDLEKAAPARKADCLAARLIGSTRPPRNEIAPEEGRAQALSLGTSQNTFDSRDRPRRAKSRELTHSRSSLLAQYPKVLEYAEFCRKFAYH